MATKPEGREQTRVLTAVYEFGPLTPEKISEELVMAPTTVARVLREMCLSGLVRLGRAGWCTDGVWSPYWDSRDEVA